MERTHTQIYIYMDCKWILLLQNGYAFFRPLFPGLDLRGFPDPSRGACGSRPSEKATPTEPPAWQL